MALDYVQRNYTHYSRLSTRRINGIVLHHSAGSTPVTTFQSEGSWHWMVGKDALYRDVPESFVAWHVGNTLRWRPGWVPLGAGQGKTSDINAVSVGIELVYAPQDGEVPNDYQYATLRALLDDLYTRYGLLPAVGHGEVDSTRWPTEPHALDWTRAGFGPRQTDGRYWSADIPEPPPEPAPEPEPPMETPLFTDAELEYEARPLIWREFYVEGTGDFAIPQRWKAELRKGNDLGAPLAGEESMRSGGSLQRFAHGTVFYRNGSTTLVG